MIRFIYDIKECYKNKKIYIWDLNRNSVELATYALFKGVVVEGFVLRKNIFPDKTFINRPIIDLDSAKKIFGILVVSNACDDSILSYLVAELTNMIIIHADELYTFSDRLKNKSVFVYGIGGGARALSDVLKKENVSIKAYIQTDAKTGMTFKGVPVLNREALLREDNPVVIVSVLNDIVQKEIVDGLSEKNDIEIYISEIVDRITAQQEVLLPSINEAIKEGKLIYLLGEQNAYTDKVIQCLMEYDIYVSGVVSLEDIYDEYASGLENKFFVITFLENEKVEQARDVLCDLGYTLEKFDFSGIRIKTRTDSKYKTMTDYLLGYCVKGNKGTYGYQIHGDDSAKCRILVLGGSTSTETVFDTKGWVQCLYEKLSRTESVVIYNASNCGYSVVQELLVLMRDGYVLKPDIVISMSGYNNSSRMRDGAIGPKLFGEGFEYKTIRNEFNVNTNVSWLSKWTSGSDGNSGLESDEDLFHFWLRNEKILRSVAESIGAVPYIFLQPMYMRNDADTLFEYNVFVTGERKKFVDQYTGSNEECIDITRLFGGTSEMYIDEIHYSSKGNKIIADKVYEIIIDEVRARSNR